MQRGKPPGAGLQAAAAQQPAQSLPLSVHRHAVAGSSLCMGAAGCQAMVPAFLLHLQTVGLLVEACCKRLDNQAAACDKHHRRAETNNRMKSRIQLQQHD